MQREIYNYAAQNGGVDENGVAVLILSVEGKKQGIKATYQCSCGYKVWGKPELAIICGKCETVAAGRNKDEFSEPDT